MFYKNISVLLLILLFQNLKYVINNNQYSNFSFSEWINLINLNKLSEENYTLIKENIIKVINNYYVYLDILKAPPKPFTDSFDLIEKLNSINTKNTSYFNFYKNLRETLYLTKDLHLGFYNYDIISQFYAIIPIKYYVISKNDNNYLYLKLYEEGKKFFSQDLINEIIEKQDYKIIKINNQEPFDYIQNFGYKLLKDEHAQFTFNLNKINDFPMIRPLSLKYEEMTNIEIEFENSKKITLDYRIYRMNKKSNEFNKYFLNKISQYSNIINPPSLIQLEQNFLKSNNNNNNNSNKKISNKNNNNKIIIWDKNFEDKIKYKIDNDLKVNIILQTSFDFNKIEETTLFFKEMMESFSLNSYPIIIIESNNSGGSSAFSSFFQKILNFENSMTKLRFSKRSTEKTINNMKESIYLDLEKCELKSGEEKIETFIEEYNKNIKHNRTKIYNSLEFYIIFNKLKNYIPKYKKRKPTEIIIFTDSYSYSATSFFIKDIQESGNGIIIGYNGNPSNKKKKDKFNSSQSPSSMDILEFNFSQDENILFLKLFNLSLFVTLEESYDDSYLNNNILHIPREFLINLIDERSNIYGEYFDEKYFDFVNYGLNIVNKYKNECNFENKNLLLISDECKFDNNYTFGGFVCGNNNLWNKSLCQASFCSKGYIFDYYHKKCIIDFCDEDKKKEEEEKRKKEEEEKRKKMNNYSTFFYVFIFICIVIFIILISFFIYQKYCKKEIYNNLSGELISSYE